MKKYFLSFGLLLTVSLATAVFYSCSKDDKNNNPPSTDYKLTGTEWGAAEIPYSISFLSENSGEINIGSLTEIYSYALSGNIITITLGKEAVAVIGNNSIKLKIVDDNILLLLNPDGSSTSIILTKKQNSGNGGNENDSIALVTNNPVDIGEDCATTGGTITKGAEKVIERGVCWSDSSIPVINNNKMSGAAISAYTCKITGLLPNTTYFVRAYAKNAAGTYYYGDTKSFKTAEKTIPITLVTNEPTEIGEIYAIIGGTITKSTEKIIARGVCWSTTNTMPTTNYTITGTYEEWGEFSRPEDPNLKIGSSTATYYCYMYSLHLGLVPGTVYYVRAFAISESNVKYYGNTVTFKTLGGDPVIPDPVVTLTTSAVSNITSSSASVGGTITQSNVTIVERGVCWSASSTTPTINDNKMLGDIATTYTCNITGLLPNTPYYVRAYAKDAAGVYYYGDTKSFSTVVEKYVSVSTLAVGEITTTSAKSGALVAARGISVVESGICWSAVSALPTINDNKIAGSGYNCLMTGLTSGTTYYVRAYARTASNIYYGGVLTFTIPYFMLGQSYEGGVIAYIDNTGQHGIIMSPADVDEVRWSNGTDVITNATGSTIGSGLANTPKIVNAQGTGYYAASTCYNLTIGIYSDWVLPSIGDLEAMNGRLPYGAYYWSSTEYSQSNAWVFSTSGGGGKSYSPKTRVFRVRAIRYF